MFRAPRLFVNVLEITYAPTTDEVVPGFEITQTNQQRRFRLLAPLDPELVTVPPGIGGVPLKRILELEENARRSYVEDWPEALRRASILLEMTHLILVRGDDRTHYLAAAPMLHAFNLANLRFADAEGRWATSDHPELESVDVTRLVM